MSAEIFAVWTVSLFALSMVLAGVYGLVKPAMARRFMHGFAASFKVHIIEMSLRLVFGCALILAAPSSASAAAYNAIGLIMVITSALLLLLPWRWHHWFAKRVIPSVNQFIKCYCGLVVFTGIAVLLGLHANTIA